MLRRLLVLVALPLGSIAAPAGAADFKVGVGSRQIAPPEPYEWRGAATHALDTVIWYPADPRGNEPSPPSSAPGQPAPFETGDATTDAALARAPARFPVILLSHGTGGTAQSLAWLAVGLATQGYVVAGVNHPGNTALEPKTVQGFTLWWQRARDLSVMLDALLADAQFAGRLDPARVGAAGFSRGGYTVIALAGGIAAPTVFGIPCRDCRPPAEMPDLVERSEALQRTDPAYAAALRGAGVSVREPRVRAVFTIAPGLAQVMTSESLAAITLPVAIVAGSADTIVPPEFNARIYAAKIPGAALTIFPGAVGHYTFLAPCTATGRDALPRLCIDAAGIERGAIHASTIARAADFFGANLEVSAR
jgi:predicted dienelactone hydrolase